MSKFSDQIAAGRLLARLPQWCRKEAKALADIRDARRLGPGYLALSWGKQSTCLAHMVFRAEPDIRCVFWKNPTSEILNNFDEVRDAFLARWPVDYVEFPEGDTDLKGNGDRYLAENGLRVLFMGLAKCESKARRITLKRGDRRNIYRYKTGRYRCCPLADWTDEDIAAYIAKYDIPVLASYRRYGLQTRTSAGVTPGSHAAAGIDLLTSEKQHKIREHYGHQAH
jgi:phosphoadenosine phosphosulfate reductase